VLDRISRIVPGHKRWLSGKCPDCGKSVMVCECRHSHNGDREIKRTTTVARCTLLRPSGMVSGFWATAIETLLWLNCVHRAPFTLIDKEGGSIDIGRNQMVQLVLDHDKEQHAGTEAILWIDDDVLIYSPQLLIRLWGDMQETGADVVSGSYFLKTPTPQPLIFDGPGETCARFVPDQLTERYASHMGLTLVKLDVYRRMRDELKLPLDRTGLFPNWYCTSYMDASRGAMQVKDGVLDLGCTEDFWFYKHLRSLGGKHVVDTTMHAFGFHYDAASDQGWPIKQYEMWRERKPITWEVDGNLIAWPNG
jgi:hypothetical protein